jgi:hypothetical protein
LLLIELHTIAPHLLASNFGKTAASAYEVNASFSSQYIIEIAVLHAVCVEVGL